ncbi:MAG: alcohol dehydrogenase [Cytophagaceae bacterium]|nr:MAG: alcohol dehydrogenase [Cytophagaceae bacterium]
MKALLLAEKNQPLQQVDVPTPTAGPGEFLIRLDAAALNHRDVFIQQGLYPGIKLPAILGSDGAGTVIETGEGVDSTWRGQAVVINPAMHWGDNPKFYGSDFRILGMPDHGTFAEYVVAGKAYVHHKPAHLSFEQAAALPLAGLTAWRALMTRAALHTSGTPEKVLITGIGGGAALFALQFAVRAGAEVWVTSGSDEKLAKAKALGATGGVNYRDSDWAKTLMTQTGGNRGSSLQSGYFDVVIDSAGGPGFAKLIDVTAPGGRIAFFGGTAGNIPELNGRKIFWRHLTLLGTTLGTFDEFGQMLAYVNEYKIEPVIDEAFPLADAEKAISTMATSPQFGKLVLSIG